MVDGLQSQNLLCLEEKGKGIAEKNGIRPRNNVEKQGIWEFE